MTEVMGPLPGPEKWCPFDLRTEQRTNCGSYLRLLLTYASEPGSRVPAYLLVPHQALTGAKKLPAILALHPTDMRYGHRVLVEQLSSSYRAYGRDLAERGYVVIAPAYPLMANYQPDLQALGYQSGTMKAIHDNIRALDLLETLPFVRKGKFGAIGHSLGGHNAIIPPSSAAHRRGRLQLWVRLLHRILRWQPGQLAARARLVPNSLYAPPGRLPRAPGRNPLQLP